MKHQMIWFLIILLTACQITEPEIIVNSNTFIIKEDNIIQTKSSFLDDGKIKIGFFTDVHEERTEEVAQYFNDVDLIIGLGDYVNNEALKQGAAGKAAATVIKPFLETGLPVMLITGNHDDMSDFHSEARELQREYKNLFVINNVAVDLDGVNIVAIGGYHADIALGEGAYKIKSNDYKWAAQALYDFSEQDEVDILATHGPADGKSNIDITATGINIGDETLAQILNNEYDPNIELSGSYHVFGHIHESNGTSEEFKAGISQHIGPVTSYLNKKGKPYAVVMTIGNEVSFEDLI